MKKFFAIMMALVLVLALSVTAFAAEDEVANGTITITNAVKGDTYSVYKIFTAKLAVDGNGKPVTDANGKPVVAYSIQPGDKFFDHMFGTNGTAGDYFDYNATTGAVSLNLKNGKTEANMFEYLQTMVRTKNGETAVYAPDATPITAGDGPVVFSGLAYGYYLIDKGTAAAVTIDTNTPSVEVIDKNQEVGGFKKEILNDDTGVWTDEISSNVGDTEKFKIEFTATNYDGEFPVKYYTVKDVNGEALTINYNPLKVTVGGTVVTKGGTTATNGVDAQWFLVQNGDSFDIIIPWLTGYSFGENGIVYGDISNADFIYKGKGSTVNVVIEYTATVEEGADIGKDAANIKNKNTAHLEWSYSNETGKTGDDVTNILVYALGIEKVDSVDNTKYLAGAEFKLYRDANCTDEVKVNAVDGKPGVYVLNANGTATIKTDSTGQIAIIGLKEGTYYLKETKAPDGYNMVNDQYITVKVGSADGVTAIKEIHTYNANTVTVLNSQGTELPSTGGMGTMLLITIGTIIAMAFAVLLITHKKMSVYHD